MFKLEKTTEELQKEINELKIQLEEANAIISAIKEGSIDALVLNQKGKPTIYSIESADYTYRVLIEKFSEGALSLSDNGLILFCNDYFARLVGTTPNKLVGTYFYSMIDTVGLFQDLKQSMKKGVAKGEIMLNISGKKIPVYISIADLRPLVPAIGIVVTDLSEKRKTEQDLSTYQKELESKVNQLNETNNYLVQFIHIISHDVKEPLRKIMAYGSRLVENTSGLLNSADLHYVSVMQKAAHRLTNLVKDLTRYSLSTSVPEYTMTDLTLILQEVIEDLEITIVENDAKIKFDFLPKLQASPFQMKLLFQNLLANAIKFRKKNELPKITITNELCDCVDPYDPNKKFYRISIQDNGIGIEKEYLDKVFTIFRKFHDPKEYEGNGVGLAICKKIIENHGGKINVQSKPGEGAVFNLYFPVKATK